MSWGPRPPEPRGYDELDRIMVLIDAGEGRRVVAPKLRALGQHPIALKALELVERDRFVAAAELIARALAHMAGSPVEGVPWYEPKPHEVTKPTHRRG